jgi:invasion protein IalB
MLRPIAKFVGFFTGGSALLLGATSCVMAAEWQVNKELSGNKDVCTVASAKMPVDDGYQKISAQIVVDSKTVIVKTESELDPGFSDIGMRVGNRDLIPMDKVGQKKQAVFETSYANIVELFKLGREVTVTLRFWPTWPVTGTHSVSFSLMGFTKAYDEAAKCK